MSYKVYLAEYTGMARNHHAIFVETETDGKGYIYQVSGDIQNGMKHDHKGGKKPDDSLTFEKKTLLGTVSKDNYGRIETICNSLPPPKKQYDGAKLLFPKKEVRRCQEWTKDAIAELKKQSVLV